MIARTGFWYLDRHNRAREAELSMAPAGTEELIDWKWRMVGSLG